MTRRTLGAASSLLSLLLPAASAAQPATAPPPETPAPSPAPAVASPAPAPPTPAQARARVSLPWTMRPAAALTLVRLDTSWAFTNTTTTGVTLLTAGYAYAPGLAGIYVRQGVVYNGPTMGASGAGTTNPLLFGLITPQLHPMLRLAVFAGVALPLGMGWGEAPDLPTRKAVLAGIYARSAMDNALFAMNYLTGTVGLGLAFNHRGFTAQVEATYLQLFRVRAANLDADEFRSNLTLGLHVGYQVLPWLTPSVELHYQHWLSTPAAVAANSSLRGQLSLEFGARFNVPLTRSLLLRPGVSFGAGLGGPMWADNYRVLHVDLPLVF